MRYDHAKQRIEFGLKLLGVDGYGYTVVNHRTWMDRLKECDMDEHPEISSTACVGCKSIYLKSSEVAHHAEEDLIRYIRALAHWIKTRNKS